MHGSSLKAKFKMFQKLSRSQGITQKTQTMEPKAICLPMSRVLVRFCVSVFPCFFVSVFLHNNSKSNQSRNMKLDYIVVYENISDKFDIGHCRTKVKVTGDFKSFLHLQQYKLSGPITQLWYKLGGLY